MNRSLFQDLLRSGQQHSPTSSEEEPYSSVINNKKTKGENAIREWIQFSQQQASKYFSMGQYSKITNKIDDCLEKYNGQKQIIGNKSEKAEELIDEFY